MSRVPALAVPFAFVRSEARRAVVVMRLSFPAMIALHAAIGYVRLLGDVHVVIWTPFVVYLWRRRDKWPVREILSGKRIFVLFLTMLVALAFDYADIVRRLLGARR
jgi:hypothetical protein